MGVRRSSHKCVCQEAGRPQVEIQVLEAAGLEALLTQTAIEAPSFERMAHESA